MDEPLSAINSCLSEIGETPIRKKKLHQAKYPEQKVEKITAAMKKSCFVMSRQLIRMGVK